MILAQVVLNETLQTPDKSSVSLLDLMIAGGPMMIPIFISWVIALYVFIERFRHIHRANLTPPGFMNKIKDLVVKGDLSGASKVCAQYDMPIARMIEKGLSRIGSPLKNIETSIENVGKLEIFKLEKNLSLLATVSGVAPMMGFLGTVIGMVQAFIAISQEEGSVSPKLLADGIYTAMLTTVAGLFVGITAYVGYNYLVTKVLKIINKMEYTTVEFVDLLQEPR